MNEVGVLLHTCILGHTVSLYTGINDQREDPLVRKLYTHIFLPLAMPTRSLLSVTRYQTKEGVKLRVSSQTVCIFENLLD